MIYELKSEEFFRCKDLLSERGLLEAKAVVYRVNPGRVFVDDIETPASGLIWLGNNDGFIFIGNENNELFNSSLNEFIDEIILPEAAKVGLNWFEGMGDHGKWNATIEQVFKNRNLGSWSQKVYMLNADDYQHHGELNMELGYRQLKITREIFHNKNHPIKNIEFLRTKVLDFWTSPDMFFKEGIGYCMIYNEQIVSVCFSGFVVGNKHAVSIETLEEHRGKKLAQKIAKSYVKDCLDNNMVPYWDCIESNRPSIAIAENLGFKNTFNYIGYEFLMKQNG